MSVWARRETRKSINLFLKRKATDTGGRSWGYVF